MYHVSQLPQLLPVVFVQPQTQFWIKEADEKKMQKCKIYVTKKQKRPRPVYSLLCVLFFILIWIKSTAKYWYLHRFRESIKAGSNGQELGPKAGSIFCNSICPDSPYCSCHIYFLNCSHLTIDKTAGPDDLKFVFYCLSEQQ